MWFSVFDYVIGHYTHAHGWRWGCYPSAEALLSFPLHRNCKATTTTTPTTTERRKIEWHLSRCVCMHLDGIRGNLDWMSIYAFIINKNEKSDKNVRVCVKSYFSGRRKSVPTGDKSADYFSHYSQMRCVVHVTQLARRRHIAHRALTETAATAAATAHAYTYTMHDDIQLLSLHKNRFHKHTKSIKSQINWINSNSHGLIDSVDIHVSSHLWCTWMRVDGNHKSMSSCLARIFR